MADIPSNNSFDQPASMPPGDISQVTPTAAPVPVEAPVSQPPAATPPIDPSSTPRSKKPLGILLFIFFLIIAIAAVVFVIGKVQTTNAPVELTWWGLWEEERIVTPLIAEYQQAHPNVKINYVSQAKEDYRERLTSSLARGAGPDIFRIHNTWLPMFRSELDTLPQDVMTAQEYSSIFYPVIVSDMTLSDGIAGIPLGFDTLSLFINEDIFDTYGKTPPQTWDDLRTLAKELTIKDETGTIRQAGAALGRTENIDHWPEILALLMIQNGSNLASPQGTLAQAALDFYVNFAKVDGVWDVSLPPSTAAFAGGKLAMYFGSSWRLHEIKAINPSLRFKVVKVPQLPKERPDEPDIAYASYWAESVWSDSKAKKEAWEFLKFLSSRETLEKFYQNASTVRGFGEPYPRMDMENLLASDPKVSPFVTQGKFAKSWYLASRTFDGPTGINSQIIKYFADAVNGVNLNNTSDSALQTVAAGVSQVLIQYGLIKPPPPPQ